MKTLDVIPVAGSSGNLPTTFTAIEKVRDALELWLDNFSSPNTKRAYAKEIEAFATFAGYSDTAAAVAAFLALSDGQAHAVADAWRAHKLEKGLSPASVNRSMAALNSLVATAADQDNGVKAARDAAILRLAYGLGLRRSELASLDVGHVDLTGGTVSVMGKGRNERERLTVPQNARQALEAWLAVRGSTDKDAPLFVALDRHTKGSRISGSGVYHVVRTLGEEIGIRARPHGLRHSAVTAALDALGGDYRKVRAFSRHASLDTVRRYDDNRADHAGQVAAIVDALAI